MSVVCQLCAMGDVMEDCPYCEILTENPMDPPRLPPYDKGVTQAEAQERNRLEAMRFE